METLMVDAYAKKKTILVFFNFHVTGKSPILESVVNVTAYIHT